MEKEYADYLIEKTKEDYNLIAEEFSQTRREIWKELTFLFDFLKPGEKVLDAGCGNGRWFPLFSEKRVEYFGLDFSEKLIALAKNSFPNGRFFVGNLLSLPFSEEEFDKAYLIAVLHQIPSFQYRLKILQETKRVLKRGGNLILTTWKIHQPKEIFLLLKYTILKVLGRSKLDFGDYFEPWGKKTLRYYHCFSQKELKNLAKEAGFEILKSGIVKNERGNRQNLFLILKKPL